MSGSQPEFEFEVTLRDAGDDATLARLAEQLPPGVTVEDLVALRAQNERVMAWLAEDPEHARRFMADPLAALAEAKVRLPLGLVRALEERQRRARRATALVSPAPIGKMTVRVQRGSMKPADET